MQSGLRTPLCRSTRLAAAAEEAGGLAAGLLRRAWLAGPHRVGPNLLLVRHGRCCATHCGRLPVSVLHFRAQSLSPLTCDRSIALHNRLAAAPFDTFHSCRCGTDKGRAAGCGTCRQSGCCTSGGGRPAPLPKRHQMPQRMLSRYAVRAW